MDIDFTTGKRIINALNRRNKEELQEVLSSLTSWELMLVFKRGYKFLIPDILKLMEKEDAGPERQLDANAKPTSLCPMAESERDAGIRTLHLSAGSCPVGGE